MIEYLKITRNQARHLFLNGQDILITPSKMEPPCPVQFTLNVKHGMPDMSYYEQYCYFDRMIVNTSERYCNKSVGLSISFYIEDKDTP